MVAKHLKQNKTKTNCTPEAVLVNNLCLHVEYTQTKAENCIK